MLLHNGTDFQIFKSERKTPYLLVSFNQAGRHWGLRIIREKEISAVGITTFRPDWFRNPDIETFLHENLDLFRSFKGDIVVMGYSMGAYAAIKFSRLIGATTVIAVCPQYTMDPVVCAGRDSRAPHKLFDPAIHIGMEPRASDLGGRIYTFYDPHFSDDCFQIEKLRELSPSVVPIEVPFADHEIQLVFGSLNGFTGLIDACRSGDMARINRHVRASRKAASLRTAKLAIYVADKRPSLAARIYLKHARSFRPVDLCRLGVKLAAFKPTLAKELFTDALKQNPQLERASIELKRMSAVA